MAWKKGAFIYYHNVRRRRALLCRRLFIIIAAAVVIMNNIVQLSIVWNLTASGIGVLRRYFGLYSCASRGHLPKGCTKSNNSNNVLRLKTSITENTITILYTYDVTLLLEIFNVILQHIFGQFNEHIVYRVIHQACSPPFFPTSTIFFGVPLRLCTSTPCNLIEHYFKRRYTFCKEYII